MITRIAAGVAAAGIIALGAGATHAAAVTGDEAALTWAATCDTGLCGSDLGAGSITSDPWDKSVTSDPWD